MKKKKKHQQPQPQDKPQGFLSNFILFLGILFAIGALYFFGTGYFQFQTQWDQMEWTAVSAQVVDVTQGAPEQPDSYQVTYEYEADGTTYTGTTQRSTSDVKVGDSMTIKYNPDSPDASTGNLEVDLSFLVRTSVCAVLAVMCLYGPSLYRKRKQDSGPSRRLPMH